MSPPAPAFLVIREERSCKSTTEGRPSENVDVYNMRRRAETRTCGGDEEEGKKRILNGNRNYLSGARRQLSKIIL